MILPVLRDDRLEGLPRPEFRFADLLETGCVPVEPRLRRRTAGGCRFCDRRDVAGFGIDVDRRRLALLHRHDLPGVGRRPAGAAVAAAAGIVRQLAPGNVAVLVGIWTAGTFL